MMEIIALSLFVCTAFADDGKHASPRSPKSKNLFEPASEPEERHPMFYMPMKTEAGVFFQPAPYQLRLGEDNQLDEASNPERSKRDTAGALHIMTNHALPIHAEVKSDGSDQAVTEETEKPCPKSNNVPSHVENGVVFQVTAPESKNTFYELKSLRKSWPLPSKLELVRSVSRLVTLASLVLLAIVEFYPLLKMICLATSSFLNA